MYKYIYYIIMSTFSTFQISQSATNFLFVCLCLFAFYAEKNAGLNFRMAIWAFLAVGGCW